MPRMVLNPNKRIAPPEWVKSASFYAKIPRHKKRLVLAIDYPIRNYSSITADSRARYAHRVGASEYTIRSGKVGELAVGLKFACYPFLCQGYTVLLVDADAFITDACPDLFQIFDGPYLHAVDEFYVWDSKQEKLKTAMQEVAMAYERLNVNPKLAYKPPYINAGVMLVHPKQKWVFSPDEPWAEILPELRCPEQDYISACVKKYPEIYKPLPNEANCLNPRIGMVPWIVHPAGRSDADKLNLIAAYANVPSIPSNDLGS